MIRDARDRLTFLLAAAGGQSRAASTAGVRRQTLASWVDAAQQDSRWEPPTEAALAALSRLSEALTGEAWGDLSVDGLPRRERVGRAALAILAGEVVGELESSCRG